tara:strand:+ start:1067 stop:2083 length:1017 start_codon:yes stop_codon:yes gene_type:complete
MKKSFKIKGLIHGLSITFSSWMFLLVGVIFNNRIVLNTTTTNTIIFSLFTVFSVVSLVVTNNPLIVLNILAFYFYLHISITKSDFTISNKNQIVYFLRIYMFLGFILALSNYYLQGEKQGLFGVELNFTGFIILIYIYIIKTNNKLKLLDYVIWISFIFLTESRAFLIMSIVSVFLYYLRNRKIILNFITIFSVVSFIFFESFIELLSFIPLFKQTGYIDDFTRLYQFYDSSAITRYDIIKDYIINFKSNSINFLFGNSKSQLENNLMESHNSLFQKIYEHGLISTIFLIYCMRKKMETLTFSLIIIYGFFLHNLFSIPLLIFISLYEKKNNNNCSNL